MRSLVYRSLILILFFPACNPVKKSTLISSPQGSTKIPVWSSPFMKGFEKTLFRTTLDVADKHLTGISIIKKTSDTSFHFTFANEIGMTYFDMEIYRKTYRPDYIFDPINKKSFLKILQRDFSILFFSASEGKPVRRYIDKSTGEAIYMYLGLNLYAALDTHEKTLIKLIGWSNYFDAVLVNFTEYENGFPNQVQIVNPKIKMVLTFNMLGS